MHTPALAALLFAVLAFPQPVFASEPAARLVDIEGSVFVDTGEGFKPVASKVVDVQIGNRIMLTQKGGATLRYSDACSLPLAPLSVTTVGEVGCVVGTQGGPPAQTNDDDDDTWVAPVVLGLAPLLLIAAGGNDSSGPRSP